MIHYSQKTIAKLTHLLGGELTERVAIIVGKQNGENYLVMDVIPAQNEDICPAEEFYITGEQMRLLAVEARRRGVSLLGVAHSHMSYHPAGPSEADMRYCRHMVNAVYHPASGSLTWFNAAGELQHEQLREPDYPLVPLFQPALSW